MTRVGGDGEKEKVRGLIPGGYAVSHLKQLEHNLMLISLTV